MIKCLEASSRRFSYFHLEYHLRRFYLHVHDGLADGAAVVLLVPLRGVANHADGLTVHHAEQLEPLLVNWAHLPGEDVQLLPRLQLLAVLHARLAQVLQGEAGHRVVHRAAPAQRALSVAPCRPVLLQTAGAEAVAALEDHGLLEDLAADGTGQVHLGQRQPDCHPGACVAALL